MKRLSLATMLLTLATFTFAHNSDSRTYTVTSPTGGLTLTLAPNATSWTYAVTRGGKTLVTPSRVGMTCDSTRHIPSGEWTVADNDTEQHRGEWHPLWGKRSRVKDEYNTLTLHLTSPSGDDKMTLTARVYDDALALRYTTDLASPHTLQEATDIRFAHDYEAWYYNGERHNIGPERLSKTDGTRWPVMTVRADGCFMAIHEADLGEVCPMELRSKAGSTVFDITGDAYKATTRHESAWRVIMCADNEGGLIDSHTIELLNPEPVGDYSWVKPGMCLWDWRINGAVWEDFHYDMSYPSWVRMVDFAARNGMQHLVLDANWYGPEFEKGSDPVKGEKANDVKRLISYARQKGVGIWLYLNEVGGLNYPIEETLKQYEAWGASGVKYGFMEGTKMEKQRKTLNITALCAKHHLMVDFHDYPVHPFGQMRTWPNAVTREYCFAQLDGHHVFMPKTFVTSVFVNMVAGPLDMNNGMMDLRQGPTTRVDNNQEVPSTVVAEAARTQIVFSGATVIPDIPEYYERYPSLLRFIAAERQPWRESRTLAGAIGEYIAMARQAADGTWLVGCATNEQPRTLDITLDFLDEGAYEAEITEDGENGNYMTNRETTKITTLMVKRGDVIRVSMAAGGGACIRIVPNMR